MAAPNTRNHLFHLLSCALYLASLDAAPSYKVKDLSLLDTSVVVNATGGIASVVAVDWCFRGVSSSTLLRDPAGACRQVTLINGVNSSEATLRGYRLPNSSSSTELFAPIFLEINEQRAAYFALFFRIIRAFQEPLTACSGHAGRLGRVDFTLPCTASGIVIDLPTYTSVRRRERQRPHRIRRLLSGASGQDSTKQHLLPNHGVGTPSRIKQGYVVRASVAASALFGLICTSAGLVFCCIRWKRPPRQSTTITELELEDDEPMISESELQRGLGPRRFRYSELAAATSNFAAETKIGRGGFGPVYRGYLSDQQRHVAIKVLSRQQSVQGLKEFKAEVKITSQLRHRNIVQLVGWSDSREGLALLYELMPGGSLDKHLYDPDRLLNWSQRHKIALGLGSALFYLHTDCDHCVVHGDIKPANVMLDASGSAKLGDFGLARLVDHGAEPRTTQVLAGTIGYIDPELVSSRRPSVESDVYSYGVVLLEIACGRRPSSRQSNGSALLSMVRGLYHRSLVLDAADGRLNGEFDRLQMERLLVTGLWCAHHDPTQRPTIGQAMSVLRSQDAKLPVLLEMSEIRSLEERAYGDLSAESFASVDATTESYPCVHKIYIVIV